MIMAKKKLDMHEAELLMKPLLKEEKNEARKHAKAQERLKQSDEIFHQAVGLIFPHTKEVTFYCCIVGLQGIQIKLLFIIPKPN